MTKDGKPKLVEQCTFPLTGLGCITRIYTSLAVVDVVEKQFVLREKLPEIGMDELQSLTGACLHIKSKIGILVAPELVG